MGAVRRINTYDDPSWVPLFIVSGVGVGVIGIGAGLMMLSMAYSVWKRKELADKTGDPWNGRTLEWSVPSPAPFYNFAITPTVTQRDEWWYRKKQGIVQPRREDYKDIELPKNTAEGVYIAVAVGMMGVGFIWHIWWLVAVAFIVVIVLVIRRTFNDDTEYTLTAEELYHLDRKART